MVDQGLTVFNAEGFIHGQEDPVRGAAVAGVCPVRLQRCTGLRYAGHAGRRDVHELWCFVIPRPGADVPRQVCDLFQIDNDLKRLTS